MNKPKVYLTDVASGETRICEGRFKVEKIVNCDGSLIFNGDPRDSES